MSGKVIAKMFAALGSGPQVVLFTPFIVVTVHSEVGSWFSTSNSRYLDWPEIQRSSSLKQKANIGHLMCAFMCVCMCVCVCVEFVFVIIIYYFSFSTLGSKDLEG